MESLNQWLYFFRSTGAHFYESPFSKPYSSRPRLDNLAFNTLDVVEASSLELLKRRSLR
jgi:hypothetical protein